MKVMISSVKEVAKNINFIKNNNINLISIRDTNPKDSQSLYDIIDDANLAHIFIINFDDLEYELNNVNFTERPPTITDIESIIEWARQKIATNPTGFIVHCTAGISRSSAVAILIKYLHDPENALKAINPLIHSPNKLILEIGEKMFNREGWKDAVSKMENDCNDSFLSDYDIRIETRQKKNNEEV